MKKFSPELPLEFVVEVLARLPVNSLVRFKCVCKSWCSLISSPYFASLHFDCYHSNDENSLILASTNDGAPETHQWTMLLSSHTYEKLTPNSYNCAIVNNQPVPDRLGYWYPFGRSFYGLVLLVRVSFDTVDERLQLLLWNPMIGKTHKIITPCTPHDIYYVGFGFRLSRSDSKVVTIVVKPKTSVQVYSLSTRSWRSITGYRESIIGGQLSHGVVLVEGMIHFISRNIEERTSHIVLFDVNDEMFSYIELPRELRTWILRSSCYVS